MRKKVVLVETPRDAFQGLSRFIPTPRKIEYIQQLVEAGFQCLDIGSFVSPKAVPQMADSDAVAEAICLSSEIEFIAVIANQKGVERGLKIEHLQTLAFPFSLSEPFQVRNTRKTISETWPMVEEMLSTVQGAGRELLVYLSMAFGNPDDAPWSEEALMRMLKGLVQRGVRRISLADTVGVANEIQVRSVFESVLNQFPDVEWSAHLHACPVAWESNVLAALEAGCLRFDGAMGGLGGCPFAKDQLISNVPTEKMVETFEALGFETGIDRSGMARCIKAAGRIKSEFQN